MSARFSRKVGATTRARTVLWLSAFRICSHSAEGVLAEQPPGSSTTAICGLLAAAATLTCVVSPSVTSRSPTATKPSRIRVVCM